MESHQPYTRFLADRLQESEHDPARIAELTILEFFARQKENRGSSLDVGLMRYRNKYPVEWQCMGREISKGVYTCPVEYRRLLREYETTIRWQREAWIQAKRASKLRHKRSSAYVSI